jgi:hypothetical protein
MPVVGLNTAATPSMVNHYEARSRGSGLYST